MPIYMHSVSIIWTTFQNENKNFKNAVHIFFNEHLNDRKNKQARTPDIRITCTCVCVHFALAL